MTSWPAAWPSSARAETSARARRGSVTCAPHRFAGAGHRHVAGAAPGRASRAPQKGVRRNRGGSAGEIRRITRQNRPLGCPSVRTPFCCAATQKGVRRVCGGSAVRSGGIARQNEVAALPRARTPIWSARSERVYALWYMDAAVTRLTRVRAPAQNVGKPGKLLARSIARVSVGPGLRTPFCSNLDSLAIA